MAVPSAEHSGMVRAALREIVAEHGAEALSDAERMSRLLTALLPDAPGIARVLVAAAQDRVADLLAGICLTAWTRLRRPGLRCPRSRPQRCTNPASARGWSPRSRWPPG